MAERLFQFLLDIPLTIAQFGSWLTSELTIGSWHISPLGLFSIGGVAVIIGIIGVHIVRLFI